MIRGGGYVANIYFENALPTQEPLRSSEKVHRCTSSQQVKHPSGYFERDGSKQRFNGWLADRAPSPNGSVRARRATVRWPLVSNRVRSFLETSTLYRILAATLSFGHGSQIPTADSRAGRCPLLTEHDHRHLEPRKKDNAHDTS